MIFSYNIKKRAAKKNKTTKLNESFLLLRMHVYGSLSRQLTSLHPTKACRRVPREYTDYKLGPMCNAFTLRVNFLQRESLTMSPTQQPGCNDLPIYISCVL